MATKKAVAASKKSTTKKSTSPRQTTTKVTTVKAVESRPESKQAATGKSLGLNLNFSGAPLVAALIAEFVGTFALTAVIIAAQGQPIVVMFALIGIVLTVGALSGAYVNPALTVGAWVTRRLGGMRALAYIAAQILGAMLALVILDAFVKGAGDLYSNGSAPALFKALAIPKDKEWFIFAAEFVGSIVFGLAVASATRERKERSAAALTVGIGLFLGLMIAGWTASMFNGSAILNPAVAVGLQAIDFKSVWPLGVYFLGSILGAVVGFVLYDLLRSAEKEA